MSMATLKEILDQVNNILAGTPYTPEDVAKLFKEEEDKKYFVPNKLLALNAAYTYYQTHKIDKGFSYKKYQKELKNLMKYYENRP